MDHTISRLRGCVVARGARLALYATLLLAAPALRPAAPGESAPTDVRGLDHLPGGKRERDALLERGFVVLPRFQAQIFTPYITTDLPPYITVDSAWHTYQVVMEEALADIEGAWSQRLPTGLRALAAELATESKPAEAASAAGLDLARAYLAVALRLLGDAIEPDLALATQVASEVRLIEGAEGLASSPLLGGQESYALYAPRGIHVKAPHLQAWFRCVTWLGRRGLRVADERETRAALYLVQALRRRPEAHKLLASYATLIDTLVGPPDDLTVAEYASALDEAAGPDVQAHLTSEQLSAFRTKLKGLRAPEINAAMLPPDEWAAFREATKGLRLLPARRTADAWLFQQLDERVRETPCPSGLEVAQALGSTQAGRHRAHVSSCAKQRSETVEALREGFRERLEGNEYGATLRLTGSLFDSEAALLRGNEGTPGEDGTPWFPASILASPRWHDRLLTTALASWTGLRHAYGLHVKADAAYMGLARVAPGVVEPAPAWFGGLAERVHAWIAAADRAGGFQLDARAQVTKAIPFLEAVSTDELQSPSDFERFADALDVLRPVGAELQRVLQPDDPGPDAEEPVGERERELAAAGALAGRLRAWLETGAELQGPDAELVTALGRSPSRSVLEQLAALLQDLARISDHQLRGQGLAERDRELLEEYGKTIARMSGFHGNSWLSPDRQMGYVALISTSPQAGTFREAAVGAAADLYIALPLRGGGRQLYRGGVNTWYEWDAQRPTPDAEWTDRLRARRAPPLPAWTSSYVVQAPLDELVARVQAGEIVEQVAEMRDERIAAALLHHLEREPHVTKEQDRHLCWVVVQLGPYAESALRGRLLAALEARVLASMDAVPEDMNTHTFGEPELPSMAVSALGQLLDDAGREAWVARLRASDEEHAPALQRCVQGLLASGHAEEVLPAASKWLEDPKPSVRYLAVHAHVELTEWGQPKNDLGAACLAYLRGPRDVQGTRKALDALENAVTYDKVQLPADSAELFAQLAAEGEGGHAGNALALQGAALASAPPGDARRADFLAELAKSVPTADWASAVGALTALGNLGGAEAAQVLADLARRESLDRLLASIAIDRLARCNDAALPHLYRMLFDERASSGSINGHENRMCDDAAEALDGIRGRRFGWARVRGDEERREKALEAMRAEARERGYGP
ncbi:MAG: DUF3160 domain-containing protein [Planctomycetota bacterium]